MVFLWFSYDLDDTLVPFEQNWTAPLGRSDLRDAQDRLNNALAPNPMAKRLHEEPSGGSPKIFGGKTNGLFLIGKWSYTVITD